MKRILFVLAMLPVLLAPSCADDALQPRRNESDLEALNRLVPITQTGAGTFGCLLNGDLWIPEAVFEEEAADAGVWSTNPNNLSIVADKQPISDERDQLLAVGSEFIVGVRTSLKTNSRWADGNRTDICRKIYIDTSLMNYMLVQHFDETDRTISGLFAATLVNPDCPQDTIRITEGRFDLPYRD